jgi:predicted transposase YdaD
LTVVYYDSLLKDLFQQLRPTLLDELTGGVAVREVLSGEVPLVQVRRADLVLLLADESILHIEFQSGNDRYMPHRMGIYGLMIAMRYRRPLRQAVIYLGGGKMRMGDRVEVGGIRVEYRLIDIRDLDAREMLRSGRPGDTVLALLAGGGGKMLREIVRRASELEGPDRDRVLAHLAGLAGLRQLSNRLKMEYKAMGIAIDIEKNVILRDIWKAGEASGEAKGEARGIAKGEARGIAKGRAEGEARAKETLIRLLRDKFHRVPKWALEQIAKASPERIEGWTRKTLTAGSIEGVIGRKS